MAEAEWRPITAVAETTGEVLGKMRADLRAEFEAELAKIRIEFLRNQLDAERSNVTRLRSVPPSLIA